MAVLQRNMFQAANSARVKHLIMANTQKSVKKGLQHGVQRLQLLLKALWSMVLKCLVDYDKVVTKVVD